MRDPDLLLMLLRDMAADSYGRMLVTKPYGMDEEQQKIVHHIELLRDAGHVEQVSDSMVRITNDGYDFISAVDKNNKAMTVFVEACKRGVPYVKAAAVAIGAVT